MRLWLETEPGEVVKRHNVISKEINYDYLSMKVLEVLSRHLEYLYSTRFTFHPPGTRYWKNPSGSYFLETRFR